MIMVRLCLEVSMKLENIKEVKVPQGKRWYFKFTCTGCHEPSTKWHYTSLSETLENQRGVVHFIYKCSICKRESTINILADSIKSYKANEEKEQDYQPLVTFDCRGLDIDAFEPRDEWIAMGEAKEFEDVSFENGSDWSDYNDCTNEPVSILEFTYRIRKL